MSLPILTRRSPPRTSLKERLLPLPKVCAGPLRSTLQQKSAAVRQRVLRRRRLDQEISESVSLLNSLSKGKTYDEISTPSEVRSISSAPDYQQAPLRGIRDDLERFHQIEAACPGTEETAFGELSFKSNPSYGGATKVASYGEAEFGRPPPGNIACDLADLVSPTQAEKLRHQAADLVGPEVKEESLPKAY